MNETDDILMAGSFALGLLVLALGAVFGLMCAGAYFYSLQPQ